MEIGMGLGRINKIYRIGEKGRFLTGKHEGMKS
jgi:hypothetical protein